MSHLKKWKTNTTLDGAYLTPNVSTDRVDIGGGFNDAKVSIKGEDSSDGTLALHITDATGTVDVLRITNIGGIKGRYVSINDKGTLSEGSDDISIISNTNPSSIILAPGSTTAGRAKFTSDGNLALHVSDAGDGQGVLTMQEVVTEPTTHSGPALYIDNGKHTIKPVGGSPLAINDLPVKVSSVTNNATANRNPIDTSFEDMVGTTTPAVQVSAGELVRVEAFIIFGCTVLMQVDFRITDGITPGDVYSPNVDVINSSEQVVLRQDYTGLTGAQTFNVQWAPETSAGSPFMYTGRLRVDVTVLQKR